MALGVPNGSTLAFAVTVMTPAENAAVSELTGASVRCSAAPILIAASENEVAVDSEIGCVVRDLPLIIMVNVLLGVVPCSVSSDSVGCCTDSSHAGTCWLL